MSTECTATPLAISELLLAGDLILNLSSEVLNTLPGVMYLTEQDGQLRCSKTTGQLVWQEGLTAELAGILPDHEINRVVVVCGPDSSVAEQAAAALSGANIRHLLVRLSADCDASAFMDEEDAEAVSERLRQLGYL